MEIGSIWMVRDKLSSMPAIEMVVISRRESGFTLFRTTRQKPVVEYGFIPGTPDIEVLPITPIELLMAGLPREVIVETVLVPEQCARIYIGDKPYHVTIEEIVT